MPVATDERAVTALSELRAGATTSAGTEPNAIVAQSSEVLTESVESINHSAVAPTGSAIGTTKGQLGSDGQPVAMQWPTQRTFLSRPATVR